MYIDVKEGVKRVKDGSIVFKTFGVLAIILLIPFLLCNGISKIVFGVLLALDVLFILVTLFMCFMTRGSKKEATRNEIDNALSKLAASSRDYQDPPPESAMCYAISPPEVVSIRFQCDKCGRVAAAKVYEGEEELMSNYRNLANKFVELGHKAEVMCLCDDCATRHFPSNSSWRKNNIVFAFTAGGSSTPVYSFPSSWTYMDLEYRLALSFLNGADTVEKLAEETGTNLKAQTYLEYVRSVIGSTKR